MVYTTDFDGKFDLDKPLTDAHHLYLTKFAETRRMKRNAEVAEGLYDPIRKAAGLPIGLQGACFVGTGVDMGQGHDESVLDHNTPPKGQPGLWCQWVPNDAGTAIEWDYSEKFYAYVDWIEYLIYHFLKPWGYVLNGEVEWDGEERGDIGIIIIRDNKVEIKHGKISYE